MNISLQPYGPLIEVLGPTPITLETSATTASELLAELQQRYPDLQPWKNRIACAIGDSLLAPNSPLHDQAEVALIPPVSGG